VSDVFLYSLLRFSATSQIKDQNGYTYPMPLSALTAVTANSTVLWDMTPCSEERTPASLFLLDFLLDPDDGGSTLLRNACKLLSHYAVLRPRRCLLEHISQCFV
jgi:hypothetical protein